MAIKKTRGDIIADITSLRGRLLHRPASLTIGVGTLRALCQEWNRLENLEYLVDLVYLEYLDCGNKKNEGATLVE